MQLKKAGFKNFVFCAGYLADIIQGFFGNGAKWGLNIEYSIESEPLGTGGALRYAERFINDPFFMCNGDCYLDFDPTGIIELVQKKNARHAMLLTEPEIKGDYGVVLTDKDGKISKFVEKPPQDIGIRMINAGIYYFSPEVLDYIPKGKKVSIEKEVFTKMVENGDQFYGSEYKGYFIDIGIPKNYFQFCEDIKSKKINFPGEN